MKELKIPFVRTKSKKIASKRLRSEFRNQAPHLREKKYQREYDAAMKEKQKKKKKVQQQRAQETALSVVCADNSADFDDGWVNMEIDEESVAGLPKTYKKSLWVTLDDKLVDWYYQAIGRAKPNPLMTEPELLASRNCGCIKRAHKVAFYMLHGDYYYFVYIS